MHTPLARQSRRSTRWAVRLPSGRLFLHGLPSCLLLLWLLGLSFLTLLIYFGRFVVGG